MEGVHLLTPLKHHKRFPGERDPQMNGIFTREEHCLRKYIADVLTIVVAVNFKMIFSSG